MLWSVDTEQMPICRLPLSRLKFVGNRPCLCVTFLDMLFKQSSKAQFTSTSIGDKTSRSLPSA